jgi:hypothetical protein
MALTGEKQALTNRAITFAWHLPQPDPKSGAGGGRGRAFGNSVGAMPTAVGANALKSMGYEDISKAQGMLECWAE